jgi:Icc-related predicted phosphoesterase
MIYAISDLHGQLPAIPEDCSLLLIAGDICPDFERNGAHIQRQAEWLDTMFRAWLSSTTAPVVACWGNHDFVGEHPSLVPSLPWTLLHDTETTTNGVRIYGTPWVPGLPYWAFYARDVGLQARAEAIPDGLDVLMTHGPPFGYGDLIPTSLKQQTKYDNYNGVNAGDAWLTAAIERTRPNVTVCGHIHEGRGRYLTGGDHLLYNVAAVDAVYRLYAQPFTPVA